VPVRRGNDPSNHLLKSSVKSSSLPPNQPGAVSTLIRIVVGHPQQALFWWKIATARPFSTGAW